MVWLDGKTGAILAARIRGWRRRVAVLAALSLAPCLPVAAQEDPGRFDVRTAGVTLTAGVYYLDAWVEYRLSTDAREALDAGVPLTFDLDVEFLHPRWYWTDEIVGRLTQSYQLQYHALSERYVVLNVNSEEQTTFATLFSALNFLGRIGELPLIDAALLNPNNVYDIRIRTLLRVEAVPDPWRFLAFWRRDWSLRSEWYRWRMQD